MRIDVLGRQIVPKFTKFSSGMWLGDERVFLSIIRDITERKKAEQELEEARKALEEVYEREHRIAETLQRNFLPDAIPELSGYQVADLYDPAKVLSKLNDSIVSDLEESIFVTCFFAVLDPAARRLVYANAGHHEPLHVSPRWERP